MAFAIAFVSEARATVFADVDDAREAASANRAEREISPPGAGVWASVRGMAYGVCPFASEDECALDCDIECARTRRSAGWEG